MSIVSLPLTATLTNGNVADAGQVTADLLQIASSVNSNAAANGVNSDITSMTALTSITSALNVSNWGIANPTITTGTITGTALTGVSIDSTSTGVTQPVGTNTTQLATMAAVQQASFIAVLPAQPGGTTTYTLTSKASVANWSNVVNPYIYLTASGF